MRNQIIDYSIVLTQPWTSSAPGGITHDPGYVLYYGYGRPKLGAAGQPGWTPEGWHRVIGHGMSEVIPTSHLKVVKRTYDLTDETERPWEDMKLCATDTAAPVG